MNRKLPFYLFCWMLLACGSGLAQDTTTVNFKDLQALDGCWQGTITYLDYSSGKSFSMPANLKVEARPDASQLLFWNIYPQEMQANNTDTISLSPNGKKINNETVVSVRKAEGKLVIIADEIGKDGNDNKPAILRHIYTISSTGFSIRKEVQFVGSKPWINRNEYKYSPVKCD